MKINVTVTSTTGDTLGVFGSVADAASTIKRNPGSTYDIDAVSETPCAEHPSFEADNCPSCGTAASIDPSTPTPREATNMNDFTDSRYADNAYAWQVARENEDATPMCEWFALCTNAATGTTAHPVLGDVPICDRCKAKNTRLQS